MGGEGTARCARIARCHRTIDRTGRLRTNRIQDSNVCGTETKSALFSSILFSLVFRRKNPWDRGCSAEVVLSAEKYGTCSVFKLCSYYFAELARKQISPIIIIMIYCYLK
eukprot:scaffold47927_cov31-Attheya_sp.AAC.2